MTTYRQTRLDSKHHRIDIDAVRGGYPGMEPQRQYMIELMGFGPLGVVRVDGVEIGEFREDETQDWWTRDEVENWAVIALGPRNVYTPLRIEIELA